MRSQGHVCNFSEEKSKITTATARFSSINKTTLKDMNEQDMVSAEA
jgi:hypothetical protein